MDHIFGPVNSRRLGRSLGIDLLKEKTCNFNCIYCEVGPTTHLTDKRREYVPTRRILDEIDEYCLAGQRLGNVDVITITASGEPTLHSGLAEIIGHLKKYGKPIAVLTNGATLMHGEVRAALRAADLVIPSLDSALPESFQKINRPLPGLRLPDVIHGLLTFSREFTGQLWLEILLARDINDSDEDIAALAGVTRQMRLDRIQLNTVARPPLEEFANPVPASRLRAVADFFSSIPGSPPVELLVNPPPARCAGEADQPADSAGPRDQAAAELLVGEIVDMLKRRPCTAADINRIFQLGGPDKVGRLLEPLVLSGRLETRLHDNEIYYH